MTKYLTLLLLPLFIYACNTKHEDKADQKLSNQDSLVSFQEIRIASLPDSLQPKTVYLDQMPAAEVTKAGMGEVKMLPFLENEKGEPILDAKGKPFMMGNGGKSNFTNFTTDNGLALDAVECSFMDKSGNLWFGTMGGGVSKYDGKSFTNYTTAQGLVNNFVLCITEDKSGNLWFGTSGGASKYDGKSFTNFTRAQGLVNNTVRSITEDKSGNLWFGTSGGASKYDGKSFTNFTTAQGLANNDVESITEDKSGNLWFGTYGGASKYDGKSFTNYTTAQGLANNDVRSITEDKSGNLWFGTEGGGVSKYDGKSFTSFTTAQGLANNDVRSITEDTSGNLWFVTNGGGASKYDGKSFTNYTTAQGLANNVVWSITEDKSGNLWFGTVGGGVSKYDGKSFTSFTTAQGLANYVRSITEDKSGNLWFGGSDNGGVSKYDGKSFTNFTTAQGLADNTVMSITEDKSGNIWFGTYGGASKYDGNRVEAIERGDKIAQRTQQDLKKINGKLVKSFTNFTTAQGLANNYVHSITEDKSGNLWFGTSGGASKYDGKSFTNFTRAQGLVNNTVRSITEDKSGNLWFGTSGGASKYDGKSFTSFTRAQGLANNRVNSITEDKSGNLWFGTDEGLSLLSKDARETLEGKTDKVKGKDNISSTIFKSFKIADGLPDNFVTNVIQMPNGKIAVGTNLGITLFNLSNDGTKLTDIEIYNTNTGYPVKDVNVGQNCMLLDSKGIVWAGTGNDKTGLVRFDYAALKKNTEPPALVIQSIKVKDENICWYNIQTKGIRKNSEDSSIALFQEFSAYGKALSSAENDSILKRFGNIQFDGIAKFYPVPENLVLPFEHNQIAFEFAAIETERPFLVKYQYMLEGYDKDWSPITNKSNANFGNIQEGTYVFKLKAQGSNGVWSEPITYTFRVLPPWYRSWWAYLLYVVLVIGLIFFYIRWRERASRARQKELEIKVEEGTMVIRKQKEEVTEQKQLIEEKHKEISDSINYAERIQRALLASKKMLDENLNDYFILFKPKDVVSGDFYWATKLSNNNFIIVTADSTGHGVPGAIMSIVNMASLKEATLQGITSPELILNETRRLVIENLKNDGSAEGGKDGMDGSLLSFDFKNNILNCASANNPIWVIRKVSSSQVENKKELIEIKADRLPIGKHDRDHIPFTLHTLNLQKGDVVYTLTDGFPDQFGGTNGKKFKHKQIQNLLLEMANEPMEIQKQKLNAVFDNWKGNLEQIDDVCLIGIRV